ncbi:MAG: Gfo/Idh/MocA family oxidoreductase [Williamsia sp.]|nr:Gfo/Idh/MocA family oxidoreductase [Williamsia sp.]
MPSNRRKFIRQIGSTTALLASGRLKSVAAPNETRTIAIPERTFLSDDPVRIAGIGMGIQGYHDVEAALKVPGVELVACCDLYTGRLEHAKELYGDQLFTTRRYEEILDRKDVDAVIIATNDSWHKWISIEALKKGKAVYCEKPMVHKIEEGWDVIRAQQQSGKVMQIGSQRVSSLGYAKAKELYEAGEIGHINSIEATYNRQSALGAWEYTIPLDASPQTVDWERYQQHAKEKRAYEDKRFFWWRNYREYGTGMAGDLYVHLLSGLHFITSSKGPSKIYSLGALTYWKDGRNVPDVMSALMEYPETKEHAAFQITLRVNFVSGEGEVERIRIVGTEGSMEVSESKVTVKRRKMPKAPGIGGWDSLGTYTKAMQQQLLDAYDKKWAKEDRTAQVLPDITWAAPPGYNFHAAHLANFIDSVRSGKPVVEDARFGFRAAAPCLACNESYFQNKVIHWDGVNMKLVEGKT